MNVSGFSDNNHLTSTANRTNVNFTDSTISTLRYVILCVVLSLGIPGNILSAIVWLRRRVVNKNSSAVYLAALAVDDLAVLLITALFLYTDNCNDSYVFCDVCWYLANSAVTLEPLFVLTFSVERLIAILPPLQVSRIRFTSYTITSFNGKYAV